jgi:hypothetical protein
MRAPIVAALVFVTLITLAQHAMAPDWKRRRALLR